MKAKQSKSTQENKTTQESKVIITKDNKVIMTQEQYNTLVATSKKTTKKLNCLMLYETLLKSKAYFR